MTLAGSANDIVFDSAPSRKRRGARATGSLWSVDVLVVDDDPADTSLILEVLYHHPRVSVCRAMDAPDEALYQLAQGWLRPNLILLDIHMPKVNGFTFIEALREIPRMDIVPVVLLTTSRHQRDVETARASDVCSYVVKPDTFQELKARLNGVIKQTLTGGWNR
jgi:CheY-like chemotaxis protein